MRVTGHFGILVFVRDRNFNRGRSTVRREYGAIADLASAE